MIELHGKMPDDLDQFRKAFKLPYWDYLVEKGFSLRDAKNTGVIQTYSKLYDELVDHVKLFHDVEYTLQALTKKRIKMAVVSHAPRKIIDSVMARFDLERFFYPILSLEDYEKQKPSPMSIQLALEMLEFSPNHAVYVGDMREDIIAAKRAGTKSVAISRQNGSYHVESDLRNEKPTFLINDLKELVDIIDND